MIVMHDFDLLIAKEKHHFMGSRYAQNLLV